MISRSCYVWPWKALQLAGSSGHAGLLILHFIYFFTPESLFEKSTHKVFSILFSPPASNIFSPCMHRTCCFCLLVLPKFTVWLEMWWPPPTPLCPYQVWSLIWERYFLTSVTLVCELGSLNASSMEQVIRSWVWEWVVAVLSDTFSASAFQHALLVAKAHALMDWGDLKLSLAGVQVLNFLNGIFC